MITGKQRKRQLLKAGEEHGEQSSEGLHEGVPMTLVQYIIFKKNVQQKKFKFPASVNLF